MHRVLPLIACLVALVPGCSRVIDAEYCTEGVLVGEECLPADCPGRDCPPGFYCDVDECREVACFEVTCPDGETCASGDCYPIDCEHRNCPGLGEVCVDEECLPASCVGVECPEDQRCAAGRCYPIDCETRVCPGYGEVCIDGECIQRSCVGVECPPGQACASGYCYPADCEEIGCPEDQVCVGGACVDDLCVDVVCQGGQLCIDGWCYATDCPEDECGPEEVCVQDECLHIDCLGVVCEPGETCIQGECLPDPCLDLDCDDQNQCTEDTCRAGQCRHSPLADGATCDLGLLCTDDDSCQSGFCNPGPATDCDDGLFCTGSESCNESDGCQSGVNPCQASGTVCDEELDACVGCLEDSDCEDGLYCTGSESCTNGICSSSGDPCPPDRYCDESLRDCVDCLQDADCDDGLYCTGTEGCAVGSCTSSGDPCPPDTFCDESVDLCVECLDAPACDDLNECTVDLCDQGACSYDLVPDDTPCAGSNNCTDSFFCQAGVCSPGPSELDFDGDTYVDAACPGGDDCDDQDPGVNPGAQEGPPDTEPCSDTIDNDCDGDVDLDDLDCWNVSERLVMLTADGTFNNGTDDAKRAFFTYLGWEVIPLAEGASQAEYDLEAWRSCVWFISDTTVSPAAKSRELEVGIVIEDVFHFGDYQYAPTFGWGGGSGTNFIISDNSHPITAGFAEGGLAVVNSSTNLYSYGGPFGPGAQILALKEGSSGGSICAIEAGAELLESHFAAGRRALMACGRINPSNWNSNMRTLLEQAIDWSAQ